MTGEPAAQHEDVRLHDGGGAQAHRQSTNARMWVAAATTSSR